jgi:calcium permeable stress-gated cation channel
MDVLWKPKDDDCPADKFVKPGSTDTKVQLVISLALGLSAFTTFSVSTQHPRIWFVRCF